MLLNVFRLLRNHETVHFPSLYPLCSLASAVARAGTACLSQTLDDWGCVLVLVDAAMSARVVMGSQ
jgi:hypothetical protein